MIKLNKNLELNPTSEVNETMETRDHNKNGVSLKDQMSKGNPFMKKTFLILVLFCTLGIGSTFAQSVRINFIRYKMVEYYNGKWESWPVKWSSSSAYALISSVYDDTYKVAIYAYDGEHITTSICTFDPKTTKEKRKSQNLPYLNCYTDRDGDQIWTNSVSLESLLENVKDWEDEDSALYLWVFSSDFGMVFE